MSWKSASGLAHGLRRRAVWGWLFTYSHLVPPFATWYRTFHNKNIFSGRQRSANRGWMEEPKERLNTHKNGYEHLNAHVENFFDYKMDDGRWREGEAILCRPYRAFLSMDFNPGRRSRTRLPWADIHRPFRPVGKIISPANQRCWRAIECGARVGGLRRMPQKPWNFLRHFAPYCGIVRLFAGLWEIFFSLASRKSMASEDVTLGGGEA